jgi:hypothetical protein
MIKLLSACTHELDDREKATQEILSQLEIEKNLLKNSAALLFCHAEFILLGVMEAVCKSLPFNVLGCTSQGFAMNGAEDEMLLTLTVLTSDDVEFAAGVSESLTEDAENRIDALYRNLAAPLAAKPALIFVMQPMLLDPSGDILTAAVDRASGGVPVFGTCALDVYKKSRRAKTIFNGTAYQNQMALLLFSGPVKPRFFSDTFPQKSVFPQNAIISSARDNRIYSVNNIPVLSFLSDIGIVQNNASDTLYAIPLVIDYRHGESSEIIVIAGIDADGSLICGRNVETGGVLSIGSITSAYVLESVSRMAQTIKAEAEGSGLFIFSCFSRNVILVGEPLAEIETLKKEFEGFSLPWLFLYSSGEICPQYTETGETVNRFIQYSLVACLL